MKKKNLENPENNVLFVDTETGGVDPKETSLLSIGLVIWHNKKIVDKKEILLKEDIIKITPEAFKINKIDLNEITEKGRCSKDAINDILEFSKNHFSSKSLIPLGGHNTNFDANFIKYLFRNSNMNFNKYFSYRYIDTASILKYLFLAKKLDRELSSLGEAIDYFNISVNKRHSALEDALATAKLFSILIDLIK